MKFAALFSMIVGAGMIVQWALSYLTRQIPELKTEPIRVWFHIAAEMVTAIGLILSGIGLLASTNWGKRLFLVSMGMLFYTSMVSPGYFAQKGKWLWLGIFMIIIILGVLGIFLV